MANKTDNLETLAVYDLNQLKDVESPVSVVCAAISTIVEPIVDPEKLWDVNTCIREVVQDGATHGDKSKPILITVYKHPGGMIIEAFDKPKPIEQSVHHYIGSVLLKALSDGFYATMDGGMYRGRLHISDTVRQPAVETVCAA